jgi:hypothetical protein
VSFQQQLSIADLPQKIRMTPGERALFAAPFALLYRSHAMFGCGAWRRRVMVR